MDTLNNIIKGDNIEFECDLGEIITSWKIRAEFYDTTHSIKKATVNVTGGADEQIKITNATTGLFSVYINAGETTDFNRESNMEIEVEDTTGKKWTVGQYKIELLPERIKWTDI